MAKTQVKDHSKTQPLPPKPKPQARKRPASQGRLQRKLSSGKLNEASQVLAWGWNAYGQCGTGSKKEIHAPEVWPFLKPCSALTAWQRVSGFGVEDVNEDVVEIAAGAFHTVAVTSSGNVFTWGECKVWAWDEMRISIHG